MKSKKAILEKEKMEQYKRSQQDYNSNNIQGD